MSESDGNMIEKGMSSTSKVFKGNTTNNASGSGGNGKSFTGKIHQNNGTSANSAASGSRPGIKRLLIRNLKETADRPTGYDDEAWHMLEKAVLAIQTSIPINETLEELYQTVENLCNRPERANCIYQNLYELVVKFLAKHTTRFEELAGSLGMLICCQLSKKYQFFFFLISFFSIDPDSFLKQLNAFWIRYSEQMLLIRSVFLFLDRKFVLRDLHKLSIWDMGLASFSLNMFQKSTPIGQKLIDGLLSMIERERRGELIDRSLIQSLLRMLHDTQLYTEMFEETFLNRTDLWYLDESRQLIEELSITDYLKYVDRRLNEEKDRLKQYLGNVLSIY